MHVHLSKTLRLVLSAAALLVLPALAAKAEPADSLGRKGWQDIAVRTNLLWDGVSEPNIGVEIPVGEHWTLGGNAGLKAWPRWFAWDWDNGGRNRHWRNFAIVPEVRWWPGHLYDGWFAGADFIYTHFNVGAVTFPFGMWKALRDHRYQGSWWGGGLFGGYSWSLGEHWRIEAEAGLATGLAAYDRFDCAHCGTKLGEERKVAVVPKLGLNLAWSPVSRTERAAREEARRASSREEVINLVSRPVAFVVHLRDVAPLPSVGDSLAETESWVIPIEKYRPLGYLARPGRDSILSVRYPVDVDVLSRDFAGNGAVLDELTAGVKAILADPRSDELLISIVGLASIEGPVERNDTLSVRRARAVAQYLWAETGLQPRQTEIIGKGEAWDWFRDQLAAQPEGLSEGQLARLEEILRSNADPDVRERQIRSDAALYSAVQENLLADQRAAGYIRVYYSAVPDPATAAFNGPVYELLKAKRYREAAEAIRADEALRARVEADAEAANAYGIALYFTALDDKDATAEEEAIRLIRAAARQGSAAAAENLKGVAVYGPARKEYDAWMEQQAQ